MAEFKKAHDYTRRNEGGWVDDPDDPGGATMKGVTFAVAQEHGITTKEELRNISDEKVGEIYKAGYWRFDAVDDQRVATKIFDMAINMGLKSAVKLVQESLNDLGAYLTVDGIWGAKTASTVNSIRPINMLDLLCSASAEYYETIVRNTSSQRKFLKGWLRRAAEVPHA